MSGTIKSKEFGVSKETKCDCDEIHLIGVEYSWDSPHRYDGVSEWNCQQCGQRIGRWSGNILKEGEAEPRWGIAKEKK